MIWKVKERERESWSFSFFACYPTKRFNIAERKKENTGITLQTRSSRRSIGACLNDNKINTRKQLPMFSIFSIYLFLFHSFHHLRNQRRAGKSKKKETLPTRWKISININKNNRKKQFSFRLLHTYVHINGLYTIFLCHNILCYLIILHFRYPRKNFNDDFV